MSSTADAGLPTDHSQGPACTATTATSQAR
jgi:hypothetical protein